jgi:chloramphenicol 3-O phosphotransferase
MDNQRGKLILINGACSVGKTSCAQELQNMLPDNKANILLGIDTFHLAIPSKKLLLGNGDENYLLAHETKYDGVVETEILHGKYIHQINIARYQAIACFLDQGVDVIADEIFWREEDLPPFLTALNGHRVYIIGLYAREEVGTEREQRRSMNSNNAKDDYRPTGMHRASRKTDTFMKYDLRLDSSQKGAHQCAETITNWITDNPSGSAFQELCIAHIA